MNTISSNHNDITTLQQHLGNLTPDQLWRVEQLIGSVEHPDTMLFCDIPCTWDYYYAKITEVLQGGGNMRIDIRIDTVCACGQTLITVMLFNNATGVDQSFNTCTSVKCPCLSEEISVYMDASGEIPQWQELSDAVRVQLLAQLSPEWIETHSTYKAA